jgi:hypothetical protein
MDSSTISDWKAVEDLLLMPWDLDVIPRRTTGTRLALLADEAVVLRPNGESAQMNAAAGMLLAAVDGVTPVRSIIDSVSQANRIPPAEVARYIPNAYNQFVHLGVLEPADGTSAETPPLGVTSAGPPPNEVEPTGTFAPDGRPLPPVDT